MMLSRRCAMGVAGRVRAAHRCATTGAASGGGRVRTALLGAGGAAVVGGAYLYATNEGLWRYLRVGASLCPMAADYARVSWESRGASGAAAAAAFRDYHERWAEEPLKVCLDLRGFYVKIGQVMSGQPDMLPEPYGRSLKVLQESVPPQPFSLVRSIVEAELGCELEAAFADFEEEPIGAASIGQVHRAVLPNGRRVVVKVQYPDTERYFRMDFEVILRIFEVVNPELVDALAIQKKCFAQEFDYAHEAANLRTVYDRVRPAFVGLNFPQPYDARHPDFPETLRGRTPLVTKRVLVMDECAGATVTKFGDALLEAASAAEGKSVEAFKEDLLEKMKDPAFVDEFVKSAPSDLQFEVFRRSLQARNGLTNAAVALYNATVGRFAGRRPYARALVPPNAPRLVRFLFDAHGYELFELGEFNADPHPGNVMYDEASGVVSLIDYGQLISVAEADRVHYARLFLAMEARDADTALEAFARLGQEFTYKPTGEKNPREETFAVAKFHFGGSAGIAEGLETFGFDSLADAMGPKMTELFEITSFGAEYAMVQRMGFCLNGVGQNLGTGGISQAKLLSPAAARFLAARGLKRTYE